MSNLLDAEQLARLRRPDYTPPRREVTTLLDLYLRAATPESESAALLALRRVAADAFHAALGRLPATLGPMRPRLVALLGRLAASLARSPDALPLPELLSLVADPDPRAARQAVIALGKLPSRF